AGWSGQTLGLVNFDVEYILIKAPGLPTITPQLRTSLIPRYDLGVAVNGSNAILSWPSASSGYKLQSKTSLTDPIWNDVLTSIVPLRNKYTLPPPPAVTDHHHLMPRTRSHFFLVTTLTALWLTSTAAHALNLPRIFSDNMVLQRGIPLKIWGWADPGQLVA